MGELRANATVRRLVAGATAVLLAMGAVVASSSPAGADTIPVEPWQDIQARWWTHGGYSGPAPDGPPAGTPIVNAPRFGLAPNGVTSGPIGNTNGGSTPLAGYSALASPGSTAWVAHGRQTVSPPTLNLSQQSALGFEPRTLDSAVETDVPLNVGRFLHVNNVILSTSPEWWRGYLQVYLFGALMQFEYEMHETPNVCGEAVNGACDDVVTFLSEASSESFFVEGHYYSLVLDGFTEPDDDGQCSATLVDRSDLVDEFLTVENATTYGCLYATISPVTTLIITKVVESPYASAPPSPQFDFEGTSTVLGSVWDGLAIPLRAEESWSGPFTAAEQIVVTEVESPDWVLTGAECEDEAGLPVEGVTVDGMGLTLGPGVSAEIVYCTFTNTYEPRGTLTLEKVVVAGDDPTPATPADWTLTAQGTGAVAAESVSGAGDSADVVAQSVIVGSYLLSEASRDDTVTVGYEQDGSWVCRTADDQPVAVDDGEVVIDEGADVTCTVTNAYSTGSLAITKTVTTDPAGGYVLGSGVGFTADYSCTPQGPSGTVTVHPGATNGTAGAPALVANVPAGSECTVSESNAPTGTSADLVDTSWVWTAPANPEPVTIITGETATANILNSATQTSGSFSVAKVVEPRAGTPAEGYTGGGERPFVASYTCTIGSNTVASGPVTISTATPAEVIVPASAVCSITGETLDGVAGDFADESYVWDGSAFSAPVTVGEGDAVLTVTNYFVKTPPPGLASLTVTKVVVGTQPDEVTVFAIDVTCTADDELVEDQFELAAGESATISDLPLGAECEIAEPDGQGAIATRIDGVLLVDGERSRSVVLDSATRTVVVENTYRTAVSPEGPGSTPSGPLASTGLQPGGAGMLALLLLGAGALVLGVRRRSATR